MNKLENAIIKIEQFQDDCGSIVANLKNFLEKIKADCSEESFNDRIKDLTEILIDPGSAQIGHNTKEFIKSIKEQGTFFLLRGKIEILVEVLEARMNALQWVLNFLK